MGEISKLVFRLTIYAANSF